MLEQLYQDLLDLEESPLYKYRIENDYTPVLGEGQCESGLMLVGEAPGKQEAEQGRPFVGRSGKFLNQMLEENGLSREKVYITNIVNDRPPENRDPTEEEIKIYSYFLDKQVKFFQPRVIASLGRFSMGYLIDRLGIKESRSISQIAGKVYEVNVSWGTLSYVPLLHPAVGLYNPGKKELLRKHFQVLVNLLEERPF